LYYCGLLSDVDLNKTFDMLSNVSIFWLIIFIALFFLAHYIRAVRWRYILFSVKKDISIINLFSATMIGYGVNCVVPRLGEVYRAFFLGKWESLSRTSMLATVIIERVIDVLVLALSVLVSIFIYDGNLLNEISWLKSALILISVSILTLIVFIVLLVFYREKFTRILILLIGKISRRMADKAAYVFEMFTEGLSTIRSKKALLLTLVLSILIMLIYGLDSYIGLLVLKMNEIQPTSFAMGWVVMTIAAFGIVLPTPGGTGSYHLIAVFVLVTLYGFSESIAFAFALLTHTIGIVLFVLSTIVAINYHNYKSKKEGKSGVNFISVFKINSIEK